MSKSIQAQTLAQDFLALENMFNTEPVQYNATVIDPIVMKNEDSETRNNKVAIFTDDVPVPTEFTNAEDTAKMPTPHENNTLTNRLTSEKKMLHTNTQILQEDKTSIGIVN